MNPAAPMPTASTLCRPASSVTVSPITLAVSSGLPDGVARLSFSTMLPPCSTTPAATLVPPTSIPIVRLIVRPFARRARHREPVGGEPVGGVGVSREARRAAAALSHRHGGLERGHGLLHGRGDHVARAGQLPADAGRRFADLAGGAAHRAPGTLGRLARRIGRRLGGGHLPDVLPFSPPQPAAELPGQLLAHVAGAGPDQPALELGGQVAAGVTAPASVPAGLTARDTAGLTARDTAGITARLAARDTAGLAG